MWYGGGRHAQVQSSSLPPVVSAAEQLAALRERSRISQRRYRFKQKSRLQQAEEKVAQLTAQLEASRLQQVGCVALRTVRVYFVGSNPDIRMQESRLCILTKDTCPCV